MAKVLTMPRDPRVNPQPGDCLIWAGMAINVLAFIGDDVEYQAGYGKYRGPIKTVSIQKWRVVAAQATVAR